MPTNKELERLVKRLQSDLERFTGRRSSPQAQPLRPEDRADYIGQGTKEHAVFLGLTKAREGETLEWDGYTLEDSTLYGPNVTEKFLERVLIQKVNELKAPIPVPQSKDPHAPHFAPILWQEGQSLSQITEL